MSAGCFIGGGSGLLRSWRPLLLAVVTMLGAAAGGCTLGADHSRHPVASQRQRPSVARSPAGVVAAGSEGAAAAGVEVLEAGGNAVDAAVAAALALGVTDPGGSGLGGATWMLVRFPDGRAVAIEGAAATPLAVDPSVTRRLVEEGRLHGRATTAVPTTVAVLAHALEHHGSIPWSRAIAPAVLLAEQGYELGACEQAFIADYADKLALSPTLAPHLLERGRARPAGSHVRMARLAQTMRRLASGGPDDFYRGSIAHAIERDMIDHGGFIRLADLALVRAVEDEPVRGSFRGLEVLAAPRWNGGTRVVLGLEILDRFAPEALTADAAESLRLLAESARWAMHEVSHVPPGRAPVLLVPGLRSEVVDECFRRIVTGDPPPRAASRAGHAADGNTTHLVVVDASGTVVSMTQTLGRFYGSCAAAPELGFPYNCLLEEMIAFDATHPGALRPRAAYPTSIAPTIISDGDGQLVLALGSSGSERILSAVLNTVVRFVDGGMPLPQAVAAPRVLWDLLDRLCLELEPPIRRSAADALADMGYGEQFLLLPDARTIDVTYFGAVNAAARQPDGTLIAVADGRRNGAALGVRRPPAPADPTGSLLGR